MMSIVRMGQPLFLYQAPTGFPDRASSWINSGTLLARMNFALALATNRIRGTQVDLPSATPTDDAQAVWVSWCGERSAGASPRKRELQFIKSLDDLSKGPGGNLERIPGEHDRGGLASRVTGFPAPVALVDLVRSPSASRVHVCR